jgi:hypothetical protein
MDEIEGLMHSLPPKRSRSKLEPYARLIEDLVNKGWGYREISSLLTERLGVATSRSSVHRLKKRLTWCRGTSHSEDYPRRSPVGGSVIAPSEVPGDPDTGFHFDADEPLRLRPLNSETKS